MPRAIIRLDDPTSHGGVVQEGFANVKLYGKAMAGLAIAATARNADVNS
jgi:uncharacterized Zn-binding protein involved in type VI secretion